MHRRTAAIIALAVLTPAARAQLRAFPEAEGFGRFAAGARTNLGSASVYHVTNLNDSGAGSFRDAVSQPNRFVVFDISGVVNLVSTVGVANNLTLAGQTAPGGGISLYGAKVSYTGADNTITRYLRARKGTTTGRDDAVSLSDGQNMIFDHMSVTWGNDETFSTNPTSGATINNITIQNTIIGQGLDNVNHSAGGLIQPNGSLSLLRNLFIDNETRNPKAKGNVQFVNNVVYNWTTAAYILGGDSDGNHYANAQGNYFIQGPLAGSAAFTGGNGDYHLFADDNYYDSNRNGVLDGAELTQADYGPVDWLSTPHPYPAVNIESPQSAYARAVNAVGPSLYRDEVDARMIAELSSLGTMGQIVVRETDLFPSYPGSLPSPPRPTDTDNDAIPDAWETTHGLNPTNGNDWKSIGLTGYTRLEEYLNELASNHPDKLWIAPGGAWPTDPNWAGGTPGWDDDAFVNGQGAGTGGAVTVSAGAKAFRLYIGGSGDAAIGESVTVAAGGALDVMDSIHIGHQNTAALTIESGGTAQAAAVVLGSGSLLGGTTQRGSLFISGGTLKTGFIGYAGGAGTFVLNGGTLVSTAGGTYGAAASIGGGGANLDSAGFSSTFSGAIGGTGLLTKWGSGVVNLTGNNTFTGGIALRQGALGVANDNNLGPASNPINFLGGSLRINGTSLASIDSRIVNWSSFNGGIDVADAGHTFTIGSNLGGAGPLTKLGAGVLLLNGTNAHTGGTILRAGKLAISNSANLGGAGSSISFQGGLLRVLGTTLGNLNAHNVNWSSFNGGFDVADPSHTFTVAQTIGGSGGLTKDGPGTLVLAAANTFTGNSIINAGVLRMGHPQALQFSTLNFPTGGGTLDLNGFSLSIGGIAGGGGFDLAGGTLTVGSNNLSTVFSGVITDSVGGGRLLKVGSGNLTLTGTSSTALTLVAQQGGIGFASNVAAAGASPFGTSNAGVLLNGGKLARTSSAGAAWDRLFTIGPSGATLEGTTGYAKFNSTGTVPFSSAGNTTLTLSGSQADNEFKFRLVDPVGGKLAVNKVGSGRWIVSPAAAMTYSGDTTIAAGIFLLNSGDNVMPFGAGKGNVNISSGAQFEMNGRSVRINGLNGSGNVNQRNSTTETLEIGNGDASGSFTGTITDTGTINLVKTGAGVQILGGANSYAGSTAINGGVLRFNSTSSIGGTGQSVTVNAGATAAAGFAINQTFVGRINPASMGVIALAANSANSLDLSGLNVSLGAVGAAVYTGALTPNGTTFRLGGGGGTLSLPNAAVLNGSRSLLVSGSGRVVLGGANTHSGGTTVSSPARLVAGHSRALGTGPVAVNGGATIELAQNLNGTVAITSLTVAAGGRVDLTNNRLAVDYTGASPLAALRSAIIDGRVFTSTGLVDPRLAVGYAEAFEIPAGSFGDVTPDSTAVLLRSTLRGDADLSGTVNIADFSLLASNFNTPGTWIHGDFNHDSTTGIADFSLLAANFNQALAAQGMRPSVLPEPAIAVLFATLCTLRRQRTKARTQATGAW